MKRIVTTLALLCVLAGVSCAQTVQISWDAPVSTADPIAGYSVYRQAADGSFVMLNNLNGSIATTSFLDHSVTGGGTYVYMVESVDVSGVDSAPSGTVSVFVPPSAVLVEAVAVSLAPGILIPSNFVGISEGHGDVADLGAQTPPGLNVPYYNLLKNLTVAGTSPLVIRVEGDLMSPTATLPGVNGGIAQEPQTTVLPVLQRMAGEGWMHFILGVDMASDQPAWAAAEVTAYLKNVPVSKIDAFEIGNEPDNYVGQGYRPATPVLWGVTDYVTEWNTWTAAMTAAAKVPIPFEGPATAGSSYLAATIADMPASFKVALYGQHAYPYGNSPSNAADVLMLPAASLKTAGGYGKYVPQVAVPFRLTETNSVSGGGQAGISNTFQSALWLIDTAFNEAQAGMAGINFHTGQYTNYNLWEFTASPLTVNGVTARQLLTVNAPYYGMLVLSQLTGNQAHLLSTTASVANPLLSSWATIDSTGKVHVVLINKSEQNAVTVPLTVPGFKSASARLLTAPSYTSVTGITLGGQTFDGSTNGKIQGTAVKYPVTSAKAAPGVFTVSVPMASAVILTVSP